MQHQIRSTGPQEWNDLYLTAQHLPHRVLAHGNFREKVIQAPDDPMGPFPDVSVQIFSDLGLSSSEMARYFGVTEQRTIGLRNEVTRHDAKGML